ncbi:MAG: M36 family metallopeptidase, partial [Verrucomicrobiae bacterium]|nr:M36 family metallopeptidase [Verrucomicrobiae bacterium]
MRSKNSLLPFLSALAVLLTVVFVVVWWSRISPRQAGRDGVVDSQAPKMAQTMPGNGKAGDVASTLTGNAVAGVTNDPSNLGPKNFVRPRKPLPMTEEGRIEYLDGPSGSDPRAIALGYLRGQVGGEEGFVPEDFSEAKVTDQSVSKHNGVTHVYFRQSLGGIEVYNGDANANVAKDGTLLSLNQRFVPKLASEINRTEPVLTPEEAVRAAARSFGVESNLPLNVTQPAKGAARETRFEGGEFSQDDIPTKLMYLPQAAGTTRLVWNTVLHLKDGARWMDVNVDAENGAVLSQTNWYASADYRVFPLPFETPLDGNRSLVTDPQDAVASPFGWHDTNGVAGAEFFDTRGNNVNAQDDTDANNSGGTRPGGGASLVFDNPLDLGLAPPTYLNASITNLFYWNNLLHDIHYQYGFDEASGNFQENNYGRGGAASDPVEADAQDGSGTNNANFGTPPDGSNPRMQMYIWTNATPDRDSDLDNVIIIHEYGHGVSNRLTGGPANSSALSANQSGGMGEGWSDWWGLALTAKAGQQAALPRSVGYYVLDQLPTDAGIRPRPYTTDLGVNDYTFGDISSGSLSIPHGLGFVWCTILWEVYWELVNAHGFDPDIYHGTGGNNIALQLVMDGLKLQPVTPTFLEARDAILLADQIDNGGANKDLIWAAFAKRGMGFSASDTGDPNNLTVVEAFDLPDELFYVDDVAVVEGNSGTTTATFTITLEPAAVEETRVDFTLANDTAQAGSDFVFDSRTLIFATGDRSKTVAVTVNGDTTPEEDERFRVVLSNAVNGRIQDGEGIGTILNDDYVAPVINSPLSVSTVQGLPFSYQITGLNTPRSFALAGSPPGGMSVNSSTGVISWAPQNPGVYHVGIVASNPAGSDTETLSITVESNGIANAIDFDVPIVTGTPQWFLQNGTTHDGFDAAQSGDISDDGTSYFETTVAGPDTVRFWWKVSSEASFDFLHLRDNGVSVRSIDGSVDWNHVVYAVPAGTHTL